MQICDLDKLISDNELFEIIRLTTLLFTMSSNNTVIAYVILLHHSSNDLDLCLLRTAYFIVAFSL